MAAEMPEIVATGQLKQETESQTKKRGDSKLEATTGTPTAPADTTEMVSGEPAAPMVRKTSSPSSKRKCCNHDSTVGASPKKIKEMPKPAAKARQRRTEKVVVELPPPFPQPVEVTAAVQAKIDTVKQFVATEMAHEDSMLVRNSTDPDLVSIPELDLLGVIMTLYSHYQLGRAETHASVTDLEEAITERFKKPVGTYGDVDWVTLNLAMPTKLEQRTKKKIAHYGLEDVSVLEVEMELCARRNRVYAGVYKWEAERVVQTGDFRNLLDEVGWDGMRRKVEAGLMKDDIGREKARKGVCPAPEVTVA